MIEETTVGQAAPDTMPQEEPEVDAASLHNESKEKLLNTANLIVVASADANIVAHALQPVHAETALGELSHVLEKLNAFKDRFGHPEVQAA
jgi:hypothetical protein